jgi:2-isopropylmalate synthase
MRPPENELIYDWNLAEGAAPKPPQRIEFDDETLRDGLQSPSVVSPSINDKVRLLHLMDRLGIHTANIGLPGAGPQARDQVRRLAREIADAKLKITANCAARTVEADIRPIAEISQEVGIPIEACTFIGSSPVRQYAEDWTLDKLLQLTEDAVSFAVREGLPVMYVTEDTTRALPEHVRALYTAAIRAGARRVCVCDTVGHVTPEGATNLVRFVKQVVNEVDPTVKVDWHGHQDRGLGVINTIAAAMAGADRVHGCAIGIGERVGNTPMDTLLVNLKLMGWIDSDLSALPEYCELVSRACQVPIPVNYPVVGRDAFRTATGVHAAAIVKAYRKEDSWLADIVYSGVPAHWVGREQEIEIGPMSGESNVIFWLKRRSLEPRPELVRAIFEAAKRSNHTLSEDEVREIVRRTPAGAAA